MIIKKVETIKEAETAIEFANEQFETDFKKLEPKIYLHDTIGKTFTAFCGESMAGMFSIYEFAYAQTFRSPRFSFFIRGIR